MLNVDVSIHTIRLKDRQHLNYTVPIGSKVNSTGTIDALLYNFIEAQHRERDDALEAIGEIDLQEGRQEPPTIRRFILRKQAPVSKTIREGLKATYGFIEVCNNGDPTQVTRAQDVDEVIDISKDDFYHRPYFYMILVPEKQDTCYIFLESKNGRGGLVGLLLSPFDRYFRTESERYMPEVGAFSTKKVFEQILSNGNFEKISFYKREKQYDKADGKKNVPFMVEQKTTIVLAGRKERPILPWTTFQSNVFRDEEIIFPGIQNLDYDRCKVTLVVNNKKRTIDIGNFEKGFIPNYQLTGVEESNGQALLSSLESKVVELFDDLMADQTGANN